MTEILASQQVRRRKRKKREGKEDFRTIDSLQQHPARIRRKAVKESSGDRSSLDTFPQSSFFFARRRSPKIAAVSAVAAAVSPSPPASPSASLVSIPADPSPSAGSGFDAGLTTGLMASSILDALDGRDAGGEWEGEADVFPDALPGEPSADDETQEKRPFPVFAFLVQLSRKRFFPVFSITAAAFVAAFILVPFARSYLRAASFLDPGEDQMFQQYLASYAGIPLAETVESNGESIPLDLMESFAWIPYTVKSGDSVSKIASDHGLSMDAIIASNGISNARRGLIAGAKIRIPNMDGIPYTVKNGDSLSKISGSLGVPLEAILDANDIQSNSISTGTVLFIPGAKMPREDLRLALGELFIYPIRGRLTSPFGWRADPISGERKHHSAVDLASAKGTPIKAAMDGRVSRVGQDSVYGKYIIITHSGGYKTMYAHLNVTSVREGAYVVQGAKIGEVGSTGYSTGPHLHFAVYKNDRAINPLELLNR